MSRPDVGTQLWIGGDERRGCDEAGDEGRVGSLEEEEGGWAGEKKDTQKEEAMPAGNPLTLSPLSTFYS